MVFFFYIFQYLIKEINEAVAYLVCDLITISQHTDNKSNNNNDGNNN